MSYIFTAAEVEANSDFISDRKVHTAIPATGGNCQLIWAKFEPGGTYELHSHPHEQMSVIVSGRMRLTVGDEVRDIGPGDMWYAPANVKHGGEILGDEPVVFIDVYAPPSRTIAQWLENNKISRTTAVCLLRSSRSVESAGCWHCDISAFPRNTGFQNLIGCLFDGQPKFMFHCSGSSCSIYADWLESFAIT